MAIDATKLVELAARDIPNTKIAKALGVSDSAITQVLAYPKIVDAVAERKAELVSEELDAISTIETINNGLLSKIDELVDSSDSLGEVVRAYETMSKLHNIQKTGTSGIDDGLKQISQVLPTFIIHNLNLQLNQNNEIISVEDRQMATMPTTKVHRLIDERAKNKATPADEVEF